MVNPGSGVEVLLGDRIGLRGLECSTDVERINSFFFFSGIETPWGNQSTGRVVTGKGPVAPELV